MRVVIQRVSEASVRVEGKKVSSIETGLLLLLGIEEADTDEDTEWLCGKISSLRIFNDASGVMNLSVMDVNAGVLLVSQFTLHASTKKGNRPSYIRAARSETAIPMYEKFVTCLQQKLGKEIGTGIFGADMQVSLVNDGPVTIIMDSKNRE